MLTFETFVCHEGKWVEYGTITATGIYGAACVVFSRSDYDRVRVRFVNTWEFNRDGRPGVRIENE